MRKVMFIAPRFHTNQAHAVRALLRSGTEVAFLVRRIRSKEYHHDLEPEVLGEGLISSSVRGIADVKTHNKLFSYPSAPRLIRRARRFKPDIAVIREQGGYSSLAMLIMKALGFRCVLHTQRPICNPPDDEGRTPLTKLLQRISSPMVRYELTPLLGLEELARVEDHGLAPAVQHLSADAEAQEGINPYKVMLKGERSRHPGRAVFHVPFVVEQPWTKEVWTEDGPTRILTVAEFRERKRIMELLETLALLKSRGKDVHLTLVSNSGSERKQRYQERVMARIEEPDLTGAVDVRTDLDHEEMLKEYRHHDIFILPSDGEPAAYSPLEAMAAGLPVICSKGNGTYEYVLHAGGGMVFQERDFEGMRFCLESLVDDTRLRREMGLRGMEFALSSMDPDGIPGRLEAIHRMIATDQ